MRFIRGLSRAFATLLCFAAIDASAVVTSRDIDIGPMPSFVYHDSATGRIFTVNPGRERFFASGTYSVVAPNRDVQTVYLAGALGAAFSAKWRTLAIARMEPGQVVLVNADTLEQTSIALPFMPSAVAIAEASGKVYAIGAKPLTAAPWLVPGTMSGHLAEVDANTREVRLAAVEGFEPRHLLVDPAGTRAYAVGVTYLRTGEELPGFVRAFDTATLSPVGALVPVGRRPEMTLLSGDGRTLFLGSHMDWTYPPGTSMMERKVRGALYVLDTTTMTARTIVLPQVADLNLHNGVMQGQLAEGATPDTVYVNDQSQFRLVVVNVAAGTWREVAMESFGRAVAYNPVTDSVLVTFPRLGAVGVFSAAGDRLDTVPAGSPSNLGVGPVYSIHVDARSGDAYVTNGHVGSISVIQPGSNPRAVVNMTDLWWNPAQPGWGVFVDQQGTTAFAALFVQDADGHPGWYVMPEGKRERNGSFWGRLYRTSGPVSSALSNAREVGSMRIGAETANGSILDYEIEGKVSSSPIERQGFAAAARSCGWAVGSAKSAKPNYTSLWYDRSQPGWGIALSQQGDKAFGVIFSYDASNRATWSTMSSGSFRADGALAGELHQLAGAKSVERVGAMALQFGDANSATLSYEMKGVAATRSIQRQSFAGLVTDCASR